MDKGIIIHFFRYLWIAIGLAVILFVLSQAVFTKRILQYNLDFSQSVSQDILGWYPESRIIFSPLSGDDIFGLAGEPIYMKIYTPIKFKNLNINGSIFSNQAEDIRLGLRQNDGSWYFQKLELIDNYFSADFDLAKAQIRNNQLEIILSVPKLFAPHPVSLENNWKVILSR